MPSAAAAVIARSSGTATSWRIPSAATPSSVRSACRGRGRLSSPGMRAISASASSASAASTSSGTAGSNAADKVPASQIEPGAQQRTGQQARPG
jgi:hypothetical protein